MKKILLLLIIVVVTFPVKAQDEFTFRKIRKAELRKCDYTLSSNADAVVLDEYIRIIPSLLDPQTFINDGQSTPMIVQEIVARKMKILAENVADYGKIQISLKNISDTERENCEPHSIWAQSYTLKNGHIVKRKLDISTVKRYRQADGSMFLEFELPDLQQGSIIEYGYTKAIVTENFNYKYSIQDSFYKLNSRCEVAVNEQYAYLFNVVAVGIDVSSIDKKSKRPLSNLVYSASSQSAGRALSGMAEYNGPSLANMNYSRSSANIGLYELSVFNTKHLSPAQNAIQNAGVKIVLKNK